jgi:hypothetical protein
MSPPAEVRTAKQKREGAEQSLPPAKRRKPIGRTRLRSGCRDSHRDSCRGSYWASWKAGGQSCRYPRIAQAGWRSPVAHQLARSAMAAEKRCVVATGSHARTPEPSARSRTRRLRCSAGREQGSMMWRNYFSLDPAATQKKARMRLVVRHELPFPAGEQAGSNLPPACCHEVLPGTRKRIPRWPQPY